VCMEVSFQVKKRMKWLKWLMRLGKAKKLNARTEANQVKGGDLARFEAPLSAQG
jgi:hypothetical protein